MAKESNVESLGQQIELVFYVNQKGEFPILLTKTVKPDQIKTENSPRCRLTPADDFPAISFHISMFHV